MTPDNRAICFSGVGLIEIRRSEIPVPGPGQVLIRTLKTLISAGTELTLLHPPAHAGGAWSGFAQFPRPVGYSNVGQVVQIGAKASPRLKGALVASRGCHAAWV